MKAIVARSHVPGTIHQVMQGGKSWCLPGIIVLLYNAPCDAARYNEPILGRSGTNIKISIWDSHEKVGKFWRQD
jgi:hypothetical protein